MSRPLPELLKDYDASPDQWEIVKTETQPSTNRRNPGGTSTQELFATR